MKVTIFYSWQTDLLSRTNRGFIERALEKAIKGVRGKEEIIKDQRPEEAGQFDLILDRDTQGIAGSPDIVHTIFDKIRNSDIFVADISIINSHLKPIAGSQIKYRPTPNPNVLVELGYAACNRGWNNVICVLNTAYGDVEDLPFNIRQKRILKYHNTDVQEESSNQRDHLTNALKIALQSILSAMEVTSKALIITPLKSLQEELTYNLSVSQIKKISVPFRTEQYSNLIGMATFSSLPEVLKGEIRQAYLACEIVNADIPRAWEYPVDTSNKIVLEGKQMAESRIHTALDGLKKHLEIIEGAPDK